MAASMDSSSESILEIDRITKRFGDFCAVDSVSIAVRRGEFLTFLGPSGCGKSTLLRMIAGFETPSDGEIRIGGRSMAGVQPFNRPVGIVFQNLALFPHLSVGENIAFGLKARRASVTDTRARLTEILSLVELAGFENRRIHELSGGQKQRVALARALILKPDVLLLDEPLSALDLKLRHQLQYELKGIQQRIGTTFLFVTHDQEEALTMSDRIAVINAGRVEQLDVPEIVYRQPASTFVARFIGDTNLLPGIVHAAGDGWLELDLGRFGTRVRISTQQPLPSGAMVALSVRPEHVRLGADTDADSMRLRAEVVDRSYVGTHTRYVLATGDESIIALESNAQSVRSDYRVGDHVPLRFDLNHAALVPEAGPSRQLTTCQPSVARPSGEDTERPASVCQTVPQTNLSGAER